MKENKISLKVVNPNATGIDIESRSQWIAVVQNAKKYGNSQQNWTRRNTKIHHPNNLLRG